MYLLSFTSLRVMTGIAAAFGAALAFSLPVSAQSNLAASLPAVPATSSASLKIGVIGPFTGGSADFGMPMLNGIMQAVDEINAGGGYLGRKIEIVRKDD